MTKFLDPLDSAFILLENPGTSMNIGAIVELGEGEPTDPAARFSLLKANIASRIHEIPVLTQRVVRAPFDMTWPILIDDRRSTSTVTWCGWRCRRPARENSSTSSSRTSSRARYPRSAPSGRCS